jgi:hypothetical protein
MRAVKFQYVGFSRKQKPEKWFCETGKALQNSTKARQSRNVIVLCLAKESEHFDERLAA